MQKIPFSGKFRLLIPLTIATRRLSLSRMMPDENHLAPPGTTSEKKEPALLDIRSRPLKAILLLLVAVLGLAVALKNAEKNEGKDFYQFWAVGQSLSHHGINVYDNNTRSQLGAEFLEKAEQSGNTNLIAVASYRGWLQTYSSPFFYAVFRIFSTGNYDADLRDYRLLMLAGLTLGIIIFCRLLNYSWAMIVMVLAILSVWFDPLASDLYVGNVNCIQFATLAVYLWTVTRRRWRHRDVVGGALLGLAIAFKPNLIFVIVALAAHWFINGNWRRLWLHALGGIAGATLAIFFAAANFHDFRCWGEWLSALRTLSNDNVIPIKNGNFSPIEIIYELLHVNLTLPLAAVFITLSIVLLWKQKSRASGKSENETVPYSEVFAIAIGCMLTITATRLAWFHYYVLTVPAIIFLLQPAGIRRPGISSIFRQLPFLLALVVLTPIPSLIVPLTMNQQGALAAGAVLLLFLSLAVFSQREQLPGKN